MRFLGFGKKTVNVAKLSHDERVNMAMGDSQDALGMFSKANQKLEDANTDLRQVATEALTQIEQLKKSADKANDGINANQAVQTQLKPFLT